MVLVVGIGVSVGVMSAMFGVGGGIIMVPFIVLALEQSQHVAEGTSLLVIAPTAVAGAIAHHKRGYIDLRKAINLALTGVFGSVAGAKLALSLPAERLGTAFGLFTIVVGVKLLRDGLHGTSRGQVPS